MKKAIISIITVITMVLFVGCTSGTTVQYDEVVTPEPAPAESALELLEKIAFETTLSDSEKAELIKIVLGKNDNHSSLIPNSDTVKDFIEAYSAEEFLTLLRTLTKNNSSQKGLKEIYSYFVEVESDNIIDISQYSDNAGTYYTDGTERNPKPTTWPGKTGKFNDPSRGNAIYYETKQDSQDVAYYGDFALVTKTVWEYDEGYYGWIGGKFIDRLASWDEYTTKELWYKGVYLDNYSKAIDDKIYIVDDDSFYLMSYDQYSDAYLGLKRVVQ